MAPKLRGGSSPGGGATIGKSLEITSCLVAFLLKPLLLLYNEIYGLLIKNLLAFYGNS